jgi:hypothetical protein
MIVRLRRTPGVAVLVLALLLAASAGCGSGGDDSATPSTLSDLETTASSDAAGQATITPEGTELHFGDRAFLPIEFDGARGVIAVRVMSVEAGVSQDRATLNIASGDPFYVTMFIENTGAPPDLGHYVPAMTAVQDDGIQAAAVISPPDFLPCPSQTPTNLALGGNFVTCVAYVASAGRTVRSVAYIDGPDAEPITWQ